MNNDEEPPPKEESGEIEQEVDELEFPEEDLMDEAFGNLKRSNGWMQ